MIGREKTASKKLLASRTVMSYLLLWCRLTMQANAEYYSAIRRLSAEK